MRPERLARLTVENHIQKGTMPEKPDRLTGVEVPKAGAFVSIKTLNDLLRGCIGTIQPTRDSVIDEIMHNAVSSAMRDPRFSPIEEQELEGLRYSVDILHMPERVKSLDELDPMVYGIIIASASGKQALLLPDLEGLDTIEKQVAACMQKAGIGIDERISVQRFQVDRFSD